MKPLNHPINSITLPSDGTEVTMRPFTVKEEKIVLFAAAGDPEKDKAQALIDAIVQILDLCTIEETNFAKRPMFDIAYAFVQLRAMSVSPYVELVWTDPADKEEYPFKINLKEVQVIVPDEHSPNVILDEDNGIGIRMSYPSIKEIPNLVVDPEDEEAVERMYRSLAKLIDAYWNGDEFETLGEGYDEEDAYNLLMSMTAPQVAEITNFFETIPTICVEAVVVKNDGTQHKFLVDEVSYFLA